MKRNLLVQVLATISIPTGIYAFYRINKLKMGLAIYAVSFLVAIFSGVISILSNGDYLHEGLSITLAIISLVIPMIFIREWTIKYNLNQKIIS